MAGSLGPLGCMDEGSAQTLRSMEVTRGKQCVFSNCAATTQVFRLLNRKKQKPKHLLKHRFCVYGFQSRERFFFFFARPILCSIGPSTFKHHEHASQLHMGPGSTVRHDMRAAQETHSCMLLLQLHCKYLFKACPTKQKSNIVGAPVLIRSMMLKATYLQWRHWRALALCGKVKRDFILPVLQR